MSKIISNDTFIGIRELDDEDLLDTESGGDDDDFEFIDNDANDLLASEPVEIIVSRVVFALLVSVSLVMNLLLALAVARRWKTVHLIYVLAASMAFPDLIFYAKLVAELVNSWDVNIPPPTWASLGKWIVVYLCENKYLQQNLAFIGWRSRCEKFEELMCRCLSSTYLFEKGKLDVVVIKFENN